MTNPACDAALPRIVSLVPSATEMVCALGLERQLVGVTHECDFPLGVATIPKVTRSRIPATHSSGDIDRQVREQLSAGAALYSLDAPLLAQLRPDLIVTQSLCSVCAVAEHEVLAATASLLPAPRVVTLAPLTLADLFESLRRVAAAAGANQRCDEVIAGLEGRVTAVQRRTETIARRPRVAFLEWLDPPFSAGHWNPELVRLAGGIEGLGQDGEPSKTLRWTDLVAWQPEVVLVACCGYDIERTRRDLPLLGQVPGWLDLPAVRNNRVFICDGSQFFNRPGPRLIDSLEIAAHAIHPDRHPEPKTAPAALRIQCLGRTQAAADRSTGA